MKIKNNNTMGLTLIESLLVTMVSMIVMVMAFYWYGIYQKNVFASATANDVTQIISGIDKRIFLDGYDSSKWGSLNYSNTNDVRKFLNEQLISKNAVCGKSNGWSPITDKLTNTSEISKMDKASLVPCNLWSQRTPWDTELSIKIEENDGKIDTINLYLTLKDAKQFEENFTYMQKSIRDMKSKDKQEISGLHYYGFVNKSDKNTMISAVKCTKLKENCVLRATFSAEVGGAEFLLVNGKNSMVNSAISYKPDSNSPAIECVRWTAANDGTYTSSSVKCGVGIYDTSATNDNKKVDIVVDAVTTKGMYLNKSCNKYVFDFASQTLKSDGFSPCGIYEKDGSVIQMTDKLYTGTLMAQKIQARDLFVSNLDVKEALTILDTLTATGNVQVDGKTSINQDLTVKRNANFKSNLEVDNILNVKGDTTVQAVAAENIYSANNIESKTFQGNFLDLNVSKTVNSACTSVEAGKITGTTTSLNGDFKNSILICKSTSAEPNNYKWRTITGNEGQIMAFNNQCPPGWKKFAAADGRFLVGTGNIVENGATYSYNLGDKGGEAMHVLTVDELAAHSHESPTVESSCSSANGCQAAAGLQKDHSNTVWSRRSSIQTSSSGGNKAHENRPPYIAVNWCIYEI